MQNTDHFHQFIINFYMGKAYPFVQTPLHELTDCVVDGYLVLSHEIIDFRGMVIFLFSNSSCDILKAGSYTAALT
ncbi:hypothetical protein [Emticicia sp. C21]|uniref:hypothetical protein n=1 Tax=Emticicia sp. C21 TaxID=2302915 RepID=UPI000E343BD3|nr:hypothetical protein [Emticicia sp. C21]RFS16502.1 hypothetical protein D0T08_12535 [Emticicia sp. C21]